MNRLKELRTKYDLSLRKLQEYTGIDFSRLAVIEKTDANLESKTIDKLTCFFKVSSTYLLGKDGFIYYYDEFNKNYFSMVYEQFKCLLTDDVTSWSIVDGCIRRIISPEGYNRLNNFNESYKNALDARINTEKYLEFLSTLSQFEFDKQKERILQYFEIKEARRILSKIREK